MKKLWPLAGRLAFWAGWPALRMYLGSSRRTRILIRNHEYVLVVKGWLGDGRWSLPGGGLHRGEAPLAGLCREVKEEVGFSLDPVSLQSLGQYVFRDHGLSFPYELFGTRVTERTAPRRQRLEIIDARWVKAAELTKANATPDVIEALRAWPE